MSCRLIVVSWFLLSVALAACGEVKPSVVDAPPGTVDAAVDAGTDGTEIDAPPNTVALTVVRGGNSSGTVTSDPPGIDCGTTCTGNFAPGTLVTLTAAPTAGAGFTGWGGACSGALSTCSVALGASSAAVNANFDVLRHQVVVTTAGNGQGSISAAAVGIGCPGTCMTTVDHGTMIAFTAAAQSGSTFLGWSGACTGLGACALIVNGPVQLSAAFGQSQSLIVTKSGSGTGTVTSSPAGVNCGPDCSEVYPPNQTVVLTAAASADSVFVGWGGACTNTTGSCTVTVSAATTVNAVFNLRQYTLTVTKSGNGTVTSTATGITCGLDCTETYNAGAMVTLVATPAMDSTFAGWTGDCTNANGPCTVTMSAARAVNARFGANTTVVLTLAIRGGGTLSAGPNPQMGPASCTSVGENMTTCTLTYGINTDVAIRATPQSGYSFSDYTGCTQVGSNCNFTMSASRTVGAYFCLTGSC